MIDFNRPLQLVDGTPAKLLKAPTERYAFVDVEVNGNLRSFTEEGKHHFLPDLQNVPAAIRAGTKLYSGVRIATVVTVAHGVAMFQRAGTAYMIDVTTGKDQFGSTWTPTKPAPKRIRRWQNIYADGTIGASKHATRSAALERSKYGKVRVATLRTDTVDGGVVDALVTPTTPQLRTSSNPSGSNPFNSFGGL